MEYCRNSKLSFWASHFSSETSQNIKDQITKELHVIANDTNCFQAAHNKAFRLYQNINETLKEDLKLSKFLKNKILIYLGGETQSLASSLVKNQNPKPTDRSKIGQKCDLRLHKDSFKYIIGLRSGGFPEASKSQKWGDRVDLVVALRDVLLKEG